MNEQDDGRDRPVKRPGILAGIREPEDLRKLDVASLQRLAEEIRDEIIGTVSRCGGHLASSLGTVELTLALHYVFDTPTDKLIWDVGHQAYAHKLITGRKDRFHTLRTKGRAERIPAPGRERLRRFRRRPQRHLDLGGKRAGGGALSAGGKIQDHRRDRRRFPDVGHVL